MVGQPDTRIERQREEWSVWRVVIYIASGRAVEGPGPEGGREYESCEGEGRGSGGGGRWWCSFATLACRLSQLQLLPTHH
jgi:hypothetical protein